MDIPKGYKIVENEKHRSGIEGMLKNNGGYCPCVPERTEDTKCICKVMRETGYCCCGYLVKE